MIILAIDGGILICAHTDSILSALVKDAAISHKEVIISATLLRAKQMANKTIQ